jgi:hypothetical protein
MDKYRRIAELMKGFQQSGQAFFPATVESVEGNTCTVNVDGLSISDVRLKATTTKTDNQVLLTPMEGSAVLVGSLAGDYNNLFILSADVIDTIEITCNGQNLMQLISQLIQTLAKAQVITPAGNGTFDPGVISQLNMIETLFKQIFK